MDMSESKPDLFFGGVAPVGTPLDFAFKTLKNALEEHGYDVEPIRLSDQARILRLTTPEVEGGGEFTRIWAMMDRGNEARRILGVNDVLARLSVALANDSRASHGNSERGLAFVFRQLKHPEEAYLLRQVYDDGFHLIGINSPRSTRLRRLEVDKGMEADEAHRLVERDEHENEDYGQKVRDTFHLSDVFINVTNNDGVDKVEIPKQINRFVRLLFGDGIITPTPDEYGMFLAWASGLRSAQLGRQVGAAILAPTGEVLGLGTNEVPKAFGGQYTELDVPDGRDHALRKRDSSDSMKEEILEEILDKLEPSWGAGGEYSKAAIFADREKALKGTRVMSLTEFGRAVHAEMEAILSAARMGIPVRGATLYTTTFPCHNCTKHIVDAGIARVVFIEPYPKSLARELHSDSIELVGEEENPPAAAFKRVPFEPFVGIGPRRYADVFSMNTPEGDVIRRKDKRGVPIESAGLRISLRRDSYLDREAKVAKSAIELTTPDSDAKD